jgi:nucleotide-binding universal stress UspA family protein
MIKENSTVLIPIDFSKQSLSAIKHAYNLARHTKSKLLLMHVYQKDNELNKTELENLAKQTAIDSGVVCETITIKGDIYDETDKMAEKIKAGLIVVGLDPNVKFRSFMSKSSTSKFIKNAPCPVLTVRGTNFFPECKNILMPFDLGPESREKVPLVIQLAHYFKAEIRIVSVFDPNDAKYENKLLPYMSQVKKFIKEKNVSCTNKSIPSKEVVESIVEYAHKNSCEMIVQMNAKDISYSEMFNGTLSQKMVDISDIPVLTLNPMKREGGGLFGGGLNG